MTVFRKYSYNGILLGVDEGIHASDARFEPRMSEFEAQNLIAGLSLGVKLNLKEKAPSLYKLAVHYGIDPVLCTDDGELFDRLSRYNSSNPENLKKADPAAWNAAKRKGVEKGIAADLARNYRSV